MNINEIKSTEMSDIQDFVNKVTEYGHIFYMDPARLDAPFKKILEGIKEVEDMMDESYGM